MKISKLPNVVSLGVVILTVGIFKDCICAPLNSTEDAARKFAQEASERVFKYYDKLALDTFGSDMQDLGAMFTALATILDTAKNMIDIVRQAREFDHKQFKDEDLKNAFDHIRKLADESVVGSEQYFEILTSLGSLEDMAVDKDIVGYKNESISLAYYPDIQNIFAKSNDPEEMKYYWNAWREKNSEWAMSNFDDLVKGLKDAANLTEISPNEFWMNEHDMKQMEKVMTQIAPFYKELHTFIGTQLQKKYGSSVIKADGLIPDHLFQQVMAQTWTNGSIIDEIFPHKDLPPYDAILKQNNYDALKLYKMANEFYESLGLEAIPKDFWETRLKMKTSEDEGDCYAAVYHMSPNVYMDFCQKMDFRTFLQAHGYMSQIYFAKEKKNLPAYYFDSYDLEYPVGEAVILSASTPKHLSAVGIVTDFKFNDDVLMNRLLRLSIHTMLNIPIYFVHTKCMTDLFDETVELSELNKHYWDLMAKYVGVGPPMERKSENFDFPFKFYTELNQNKQARKFDSEVLGYQFYKQLCLISGQYPKEPLQNCDFYGSKQAGDVLRKMMELGSSKPFGEVLATLLPEDPTINAESLLEYFSPVKAWLSDKNQKAKTDAKNSWMPRIGR